MDKFYILTLGCKVNAYESSAMREILLEHGYKEVEETLSYMDAELRSIHFVP